ncbi:MAG: DNA mismatch endonuclease Vsr [Rhodobacteraceae bacterium]|nr:DNA mismatch endonuclease Vsr [Paracoccaceae bacterium]
MTGTGTVSPARSRMMAGIRGKDTQPERLIRSALHRRGFRFRLHRADLPGTPDIVLPRYRCVILVHGCFWHGHDCHLFRWPATRSVFWKEKITANRARDHRNHQALRAAGWRVATLWECALKGRTRQPVQLVVDRCVEWLQSGDAELEVKGHETRRVA